MAGANVAIVIIYKIIRSAPYRDSLAAGVRCFSTVTDPRGQCRTGRRLSHGHDSGRCLGRRFCRADSLIESVDLLGYTISPVSDFLAAPNLEVV